MMTMVITFVATVSLGGLFGGGTARPSQAWSRAEAARIVAYARRTIEPRKEVTPEPTPAVVPTPQPEPPKPAPEAEKPRKAPDVQVLLIGGDGCDWCVKLKEELKTALVKVNPPWTFGEEGMIRFVDTFDDRALARKYMRGNSIPQSVVVIDGKAVARLDGHVSPEVWSKWAVKAVVDAKRSFKE